MHEEDILSIENHYFTNINLFKISIDKTYIKIYTSESYKKMSFKNRCVVVGANGLVSLSVPIAHGRDQKQPFKDIRIANQNEWQKIHWRTMTSCYGKSPYWEYYADYFAPFFSRSYDFLWDLNTDILCQLWRLVDRKKELVVEDGLLDGIALEGANVLPKNYTEVLPVVRYEQLFEDRIGFQPNVSILDLLCMEGPNTANILRQ